MRLVRDESVDAPSVGFYLFFTRGGIARYTHILLTALAEQNEVNAELSCDSDFAIDLAAPYAVWPGLQSLSHRMPTIRRTRFMVGQVANPFRFARHADQRCFDIVHFSDFNHLTYPLWRNSIRRSGRKITATVHDVRRAKSILSRNYEDAQLQRFYREADALFVHSRSQAAELSDWASVDPARVHVVPHGPFDYGHASADRETLREKYGIPEGKLAALSFGNIRDDKNLDRVIRAIAAGDNSVHLLVAGRAAARGHRPLEYYKTLAEELCVADSVTFLTRYLNDDEVAEVFTASDWVALPYGRSFTSQSGVLSVAAHYRRPVLASAIATFKERMDGHDIGVGVEPEDDAALAAGIAKICAQLRVGHVYRFDDYLRANSWATNARLTTNIYRELLASR